MSDLSEWLSRFSDQHERYIGDQKKFNEELGQPAHFIADEDDPKMGYGYFLHPNGILKVRKTHAGYDSYSTYLFNEEALGIFLSMCLFEPEPQPH